MKITFNMSSGRNDTVLNNATEEQADPIRNIILGGSRFLWLDPRDGSGRVLFINLDNVDTVKFEED